MSEQTYRFGINDAGQLIPVDQEVLRYGDGANKFDDCPHDKYHWQHEYDPALRLKDYYWCTGCGETVQIG